MTDFPLLYHWLGAGARDAADRERERQQEAIDAQRIVEFELRHLPEVIDE